MLYPILFAICLQRFVSLFAVAQDLCYFSGGRTIIVQDRLYFMGGDFSFAGTGKITEQSNLYWIELNSSIPFPVDGLIKESFLHTGSASTTQYQGGGTFWTDQNETYIYSMAGFREDKTDGIAKIYSYRLFDRSWYTINTANGGDFNKLDRVQGMHASSSLGGGSKSWLAGGTNWLPGMVTFDATAPSSPTWTNTTTGVPYFLGSTTVYVRFGKQGVLVSVGGYSSFDNEEQREMSAVQVYNIDAQVWFEVQATGDIPPPRSEFCSILSSAPDDSSFQMTIYGGWSKSLGRSLESVYVLTMPAFQWIKVNTTHNNETLLSPYPGRRKHFCNAYKDRAMIVLGGELTDSSDVLNTSSCNESYPAIKLLDTTTFEWKNQFPLPDPIYQVPQPVINVVGGNARGGGKPARAWQTGTNAELFGSTIARYDPTHPTSTTTSTSSTGSGRSGGGSWYSEPDRSPSAGEISGGVIGGALIIGIAFWLFIKAFYKRGKDGATRYQKYKAAKQARGGDQGTVVEGEGWQKPELAAEGEGQHRSAAWAPTRPSHATHEADGQAAQGLMPQELGGRERLEMEAQRGVEVPGSDAVRELPGSGTRR